MFVYHYAKTDNYIRLYAYILLNHNNYNFHFQYILEFASCLDVANELSIIAPAAITTSMAIVINVFFISFVAVFILLPAVLVVNQLGSKCTFFNRFNALFEVTNSVTVTTLVTLFP